MLEIALVPPPVISLEIQQADEFEIIFSGVTVTSGEAYTGRTVAVPTQQKQIFNTFGLVMPENFTVEPIPSNYGLITYNGFCLTVS